MFDIEGVNLFSGVRFSLHIWDPCKFELVDIESDMGDIEEI